MLKIIEVSELIIQPVPAVKDVKVTLVDWHLSRLDMLIRTAPSTGEAGNGKPPHSLVSSLLGSQ